jgi:GntR family transcriptional regulator
MTCMANDSALRIPLYIQVREKLRKDLEQTGSGELIAPEAMLEARFAVSRITIRKAIDDLVSEGLLVRKQGRGTFREIPKMVPERNNITSWTTQMKEMGFLTQTTQHEVAEIPPPQKIAHLLSLEPGQMVIQIRRTRLANGSPLTLMVNYLPSALVPGFADTEMHGESLYEVLRLQYGLSPTEAVDTVETRPASETESERLKIDAWEPVLVVTRLSYLSDRRPLEVSVAVSGGARYEYKVRLHNEAAAGGALAADEAVGQ